MIRLAGRVQMERPQHREEAVEGLNAKDVCGNVYHLLLFISHLFHAAVSVTCICCIFILFQSFKNNYNILKKNERHHSEVPYVGHNIKRI